MKVVQIRTTRRLVTSVFDFAQHRQQERYQDNNNGYHYQKLNNRKSRFKAFTHVRQFTAQDTT